MLRPTLRLFLALTGFIALTSPSMAEQVQQQAPAVNPGAETYTENEILIEAGQVFGGTAKGHLLAAIDALGALMARAIDATGIQF